MSASQPTFANLIGQKMAITLLRRAADQGKLAHAYLFRGPAGVGKKRMALTLAAYINCAEPVEGEICGHCASCKKFQAESHPDFQWIRPDGAMIKIGQIRALKHDLAFPPLEAQYRVTVLEDVHTMRREAANSLLKTLEEPPDGNILILTADEAGDIPPTIVSRCQVVSFRPLPYDEVASVLAEEDAIEPAEAATLASVAEGSLGRARFLKEQDLLDLRRRTVERIVSLHPDNSASFPEILSLAEQVAELKENLPEFLDLLKIWIRDLLLLASGGPESLVVSRDLGVPPIGAAGRWRRPDLLHRLHLVRRAEQALARNCNRALVCEVLFFGLI